MNSIKQFTRNNTCWFMVSRGRQQSCLFEKTSDYRAFIRLLEKYKQRFKVNIFAFCLMPDYVGLVLRAPQALLPEAFMRDIQRSYAAYFNGRCGRNGALWEKDCRSIPIQNEQDLFDQIIQLEFSPVLARLTDSPVQYPWSSCTYRVMGAPHRILDTIFFPGKREKRLKGI